SGPAPPNATSASPRGSTPRSTDTARRARTMLAFTTASTPSAVTPARSRAAAAARRSSTSPENGASTGIRPATRLASVTVGRSPPPVEHRPGERRVDRDPPGHEVGVGDRRPLPAPPVAGGARVGARALGADDERPAGVDAGDRAAAGADRVDVERREAHRVP